MKRARFDSRTGKDRRPYTPMVPLTEAPSALLEPSAPVSALEYEGLDLFQAIRLEFFPGLESWKPFYRICAVNAPYNDRLAAFDWAGAMMNDPAFMDLPL